MRTAEPSLDGATTILATPVVRALPAVPQLAVEPIELRLARELHDSVAQILTTMVVEMENFKADQVGRASVLDKIDRLQSDTRDVISNLRRVLLNLREEGNQETELVEKLGRMLALAAERSGVAPELIVSPRWPAALPAPTANHIYRIVEEAVNNARRHAGARSIWVELERADHVLVISVSDDGRGLADSPHAPSGSFGLKGMRERATLLGGRLELRPPAGEGTGLIVRAVVPFTEDGAHPSVTVAEIV